MSTALQDTHDVALGLAVDRIDFKITDEENALVERHLGSCVECAAIYQDIKEDSEILDRWDWDSTSNPDGYDDDDEYGLDIEESDDDYDEDDDEEAEDDEDDESSSAPGDSDSESSSDDETDDEDEEDDEIGLDDETMAELDEIEDESKSDKLPAKGGDEDGDEDLDDDDVAAALSQDDEDDDDELETEAKALADGLSDDELAALEEDGEDELPACASEGMDDAVKNAGVHVSNQDRKDAERSVRSQDGIKKTDYGRVAVSQTTRGLLTQNEQAPQKSGAAASAIRNAVIRSRGGHAAVTRHQSRGRIDNRSLIRIAEHDTRLFKRTSAPSPTPLLVWVLVDVSGSMSGQPVRDAASVARAMADAAVGVPSMRLAIWAWSDPFTKEARRFGGAVAGVAKVWETGMPTSEVDKIVQLRMGGTPDAAVLDWAWRELKRNAHGEEKPVAVMCSDGWGWGGQLERVVPVANQHGVEVRSVAIGHISESHQYKVYGRGNYIPWQGSIIATARPLATMLTKLAAAK